MITCRRCKETKPTEAFYTEKTGKAIAQCKECVNERNRKYYHRTSEAGKAKRLAYYQTNREIISVKSASYYQTNRARIRQRHAQPDVHARRCETMHRRHAALKLAALEHYSHGTFSCACCGENTLAFLTIDHPNNDGAAHRKKIGMPRGGDMYGWLQKNNYPPGLQTLCWNCNCGKAFNGGTCPHAGQKVPATRQAQYNLKARKACIEHYTNGTSACESCGENLYGLLVITGPPPIINGKRVRIARFLRMHNFPSGYRVLCYNCLHTKPHD